MNNNNVNNNNQQAAPYGPAPAPQAAAYGPAPQGVTSTPQAAPYGAAPTPQTVSWGARFQRKEDIEVVNFREKMASKLGFASLIYAIFSTFCIYDNFTGVTMPFFGIASIIYMIYCLKLYNIKLKKLSFVYGGFIVALSLSNFLTGNGGFHFFNTVGIMLMIFIFLLHNVYDDSRWNFTKTTLAILEAMIFSVGEIDDFAKDMKVYRIRKNNSTAVSKKNYLRYILIGLLISVPVVAILLTLLSQADIVFNRFLSKYFSFNISFIDIFGVLITFCIFFFGSYCVLRFFSKKTIKEEVIAHKNFEPVIAITVLSIISLIYIVFSVIQIVYLFWGGMKLPEGYTYSQYAREGFFQLLAVSIINFLMVLFVNKFFKESTMLKVLMTVISLCTYIMIASSFMRMCLYIDTYLLTRLRVFVLWALALLAILFVAVIISIYKQNFPQFKYSIIIVGILYLLLAFARPDYIIADYNMSHINNKELKKGVSADYEYLTELSTDAAPIISQYDGQWVKDFYANNTYFYKDRTLRQFNLSAYTAEITEK